MMTEEHLHELISGAYADLHVTTPLTTIESAARARPRRRAAAWAAAGTLGTIGAISSATSPGEIPAAPPAAASATPAAATVPASGPGTCTMRPNSPIPGLPPLRFDVQIATGTRLQLFAEQSISAACLIIGGQNSYDFQISHGNGPQLHQPNTLSCSASLLKWGDDKAGYAFGVVPAGTTTVEVFFHDNTSTPAQVTGDWYLATGVGAQAGRFGEVTKVIAQTPEGPRSLQVR